MFNKILRCISIHLKSLFVDIRRVLNKSTPSFGAQPILRSDMKYENPFLIAYLSRIFLFQYKNQRLEKIFRTPRERD